MIVHNYTSHVSLPLSLTPFSLSPFFPLSKRKCSFNLKLASKFYYTYIINQSAIIMLFTLVMIVHNYIYQSYKSISIKDLCNLYKEEQTLLKVFVMCRRESLHDHSVERQLAIVHNYYVSKTAHINCLAAVHNYTCKSISIFHMHTILSLPPLFSPPSWGEAGHLDYNPSPIAMEYLRQPKHFLFLGGRGLI